MTGGDWIRYGTAGGGEGTGQKVPARADKRKPIVVWNITRACNLKCVHCYNDSGRVDPAQLNTAQAKEVLDDLVGFGVPSVLFSGGEPLTRADLFELIGHAVDKGLRTVISTNGTLIDAKTAQRIKDADVTYVGISLDGIGSVNDRFRGVEGAFTQAVAGIRHCMAAGVRVGLRLTLTAQNVQDIDQLFDFIEAEGIERACFYHLVPSGRGGNMDDQRLSSLQSRQALDRILHRTRELTRSGRKTDILTVDNHVDGVYLYMKLLKEDPDRAKAVWDLLCWNGGGLNSSGIGIGCIDYRAKVHADQFWGHYDLGDVRDKPFSKIWTSDEPLLKLLRSRAENIKGRCRLCRWFKACGGSLRVRSDIYFNDPMAPDPGCYLSDEEIGLDEQAKAQLKEAGQLYQMPQ